MLLALAPAAGADTTVADIHSAGPLTDVWIGNQLSCQVQHAGDADYEFFPPTSAPGDCGTFVSIGGNLYGPDFSTNASSATPFSAGTNYIPFTAPQGGQSTVTGSGTTSSPYSVTTTVAAGRTGLGAVETDSYVVGNEYYRTDITLHNATEGAISGLLYHGGDCFLQGSDTGFGAVSAGGAPACTQNANDSPAGVTEEFEPLTGASRYVEGEFSGFPGGPPGVWTDIGNQTDLPNTCDCATQEDNGMAVNWDFSIPSAGSATFSILTNLSSSGTLSDQITATGGRTFGGTAPTTVNGTVATFTVPDTSATAGDYSASINWGDGATSAGTITGASGSFTVTGSHLYTRGGSFTITVTIGRSGAGGAIATATDTAAIASPPALGLGSAPVVMGSGGAGFSGLVDPEGLVTTAFFQYGLDPRYRGSGASGIVYDQSTPVQSVGSDFGSHAVLGSASGLIPNALYHVRLVASNSSGTVFGADQTFMTGRDPAPPAPVLGKAVNVKPVSGLVFIKPPPGKSLGHARFARAALSKGRGFVPLTEARQIPSGSQIDSRQGTLQVSAASTLKRGKPQIGTFSGAIFKLAQDRRKITKGLTTLSLLEADFPGAPTYSSCKTTTHSTLTAHTARLSNRVLQVLHAKVHGHYRTRGRYSAATVRGTQWGTRDQCNGTLTIVQRGTVQVQDFARHKTITLHAGHRYLAKPITTKPKPKPKKKTKHSKPTRGTGHH